ncbi:AEC family transporter [Halomonas dongshanensis]|uniref:AEC family transporter n=1 Tax=Halomonas dongshanensis TaxID=2890835 RepID=A0ABT2EKV6_9GAMM|nr:AEC family transporter [Halomonas dongshanensis]MCS2611239.1 AEC family transporter [Halomonas dongshanensis]
MSISPAALLAPLLMLLGYVGLGWLAARRLKIDPRPIATLLIYMVAPFTIFRALMNGGANPGYLLLTFSAFVVASLMALAVKRLAQSRFGAHEAALLAFSSGTGNTGYFGLPVALVLLSPEGVTLYLFCLLGINVYEFTVGFYLSARGHFSVRESVIKMARMPLIYAFGLALLLSALGVTLPAGLQDGLAVFPAAYTLLGMMIIGMTLSQVTLAAWDTRFVLACVALRYVLWPLVSLIAVLALQRVAPVSSDMALAILLLGVVPMAANVVVVAMELGIQPQKGALAVLVTTLLAPILIPLYLMGMLRLTGLD